MHLFAQELAGALHVPVGDALRQAKNRYLSGVPSGGFGTYDEKALIISTLYGLPMYTVSLPQRVSGAADAPVNESASQATGMATESVVFDLASAFRLETGSEYGRYYSIGGEAQASPGRPVQPRTSRVLTPPAGQTPHGAVLIGATAAQTADFDPLISMPVTDTVTGEPPFESPAWFPSNLWAVNLLGEEPRLVVVPAQFRGNQDGGLLRRFTRLEFEVYYDWDSQVDVTPPIVWAVESQAFGNEADFWVVAQDASGIQRVVMAYTQDGERWWSRDLSHNLVADRWETHFKGLSGAFVYFVQVVDGAGNVMVTANKGLFFSPIRSLYLPVVMRDA
jgi:hypothetical protein